MSGTMLSDIELTLLSLVAEGARYGAEIERIIDARGLRDWLNVGSASFYYVLSRLESQGLLTRVANGDPERAVFQITDAGRGIVQTAVADLLCQPRLFSEGFSVGLANIGVLKPDQAYRALVQHRESLIHHLADAEATWVRHQNDGTPYEALYTHGIAVMRAELEWLTTFLETWRQRHPTVDRDATAERPAETPTQHHHPTVDSNRGKQIQRLKRPK